MLDLSLVFELGDVGLVLKLGFGLGFTVMEARFRKVD